MRLWPRKRGMVLPEAPPHFNPNLFRSGIAAGRVQVYNHGVRRLEVRGASKMAILVAAALVAGSAQAQTNICGTIPGTSEGIAFYRVLAGQTYAHQASGCVMYTPGGSADPQGNRS